MIIITIITSITSIITITITIITSIITITIIAVFTMQGRDMASQRLSSALSLVNLGGAGQGVRDSRSVWFGFFEHMLTSGGFWFGLLKLNLLIELMLTCVIERGLVE